MPDLPPVTAMTQADLDFLRDHRAVSIAHVHPEDGSGTTRLWFVSPERAEQISDMLGDADSTLIVPPGSVTALRDIVAGVPTYDR